MLVLYGFNMCHAGLCLTTVFYWRCFKFGDEGWGSFKEVSKKFQGSFKEASWGSTATWTRPGDVRQPGLGSKAMFLKKVVCSMWKCLKEFCFELIQCTLNKFMFVRIRAKREKDKLLFIGCADMTVGVINLFRSDGYQQTFCCGDRGKSWRGLSCVR